MAQGHWPTNLATIVGAAGLMTASIGVAPSASKVLGTAQVADVVSRAPKAASALSSKSPPVQVETTKSANWSGYEALGGPYSVMTGSFTVPGMTVGTPVGEQASEWVGVGGAGEGASTLIQAGVDEYPNPMNPLDTVAQAFWEVLPAGETHITNVDVDESDVVRVTIWQVSGTEWELSLTDETVGESFTSPPEHYIGRAGTAEWVVEAPTLCRQRCQPTFLAPYTPDIVFSDLGITGREAVLERITLVQQRDDVSTPSALHADKFRVAYTGPTAFY